MASSLKPLSTAAFYGTQYIKGKKMKKNQALGIATAVFISLGALSASAADSYYKRADQQTVQQFKQETSGLTTALQTKEAELREQNLYVMNDSRVALGPDYKRINELEAQIKDLKEKIDAVALKYQLVAQP